MLGPERRWAEAAGSPARTRQNTTVTPVLCIDTLLASSGTLGVSTFKSEDLK